MSRLTDIKKGTCTIEDLAYWINERHSIYVNRFEKNLPKPWTQDPILQQYKFTNAFRQLDKGTLALRDMLEFALISDYDPVLIFFNVVWYRLFNWHEHARELGFVSKFQDLENYIIKRFRNDKRIFTGAHMTTGVADEFKHISYLRAAKDAWDNSQEFSDFIIHNASTMEEVFNELLSLYMVGRFVAYEIVCDLRFTKLLENATDKLTWANMGPGAQRGLRRLGLPHKTQEDGLRSMQILYDELPSYLSREIMQNYYFTGRIYADVLFELREVEHSLCEFDKYMRVKLGEGRPRSKYPGVK